MDARKALMRLLWRLGLTDHAEGFAASTFRRKLWRLGVTECSEGYRVWITGRYDHTHYEEHGRSVTMDSELLVRPPGVGIWKNSLRQWDPPHEHEALSEADRERILVRVRAAFEWEGLRTVID